MPSGAVVYICRSRSRAADSLGGEFEAWWKAHTDALAARDVEDWIAECIQLGETTLELNAHARQLLRGNRLADPQEAGESLLTLFDATIKVFERMQSGLDSARSNGYVIVNEEPFQSIRARLTQGLEQLRTRWPWIDRKMWERTAVAIAGGDYQTAEEIVHELHGGHPQADPG
jgi:hypothetical protein